MKNPTIPKFITPRRDNFDKILSKSKLNSRQYGGIETKKYLGAAIGTFINIKKAIDPKHQRFRQR